jgi:hypothetical protein
VWAKQWSGWSRCQQWEKLAWTRFALARRAKSNDWASHVKALFSVFIEAQDAFELTLAQIRR